MRTALVFLFLITLSFASSAIACRPGETWFNWGTLKTEHCDDKAKTNETLPWQKEHESCTWVPFPELVETNGSVICRQENFGTCRAVIRGDSARGFQGPDYVLQYSCSDKLYFKPSEKRCSPSIFKGFPEECSQEITKISCCQ